MKNKINFISGETYTLAELFSENRRVIIPDLQRDYCWGIAAHTDEKKELVSGFVESLMDLFTQCMMEHDERMGRGVQMNLGIIYGYEVPENHIQLCDGQQRITTLFLLLGMLNRRSGKNALCRHLISDREYSAYDKTPYLQYAIRESALYFMSDLVCHFFITENRGCVDGAVDVEAIEKSTWFFNEYRDDPSIQSMLGALRVIEEKLADRAAQWCEDFGEFLLHELTFLYYDLENRENGEETFVVINTTGEPLSVTQNLKPLVCRERINKTYGHGVRSLTEDWEEIENWFWKHRVVANGNDTADAGFNEFLRWVTILESESEDMKSILKSGQYAFPKERIAFKVLRHYWLCVKYLFEEWPHRNELDKDYLSPAANNDFDGLKGMSQINCFRLLPLIAYCKTWGTDKCTERNLYRLYKFVQNLSRIDNVQKAVNSYTEGAIGIAVHCKDIVCLINPEYKGIDKGLLSKEERLKLEILCSHAADRESIEEAFWAAQDDVCTKSHRIWSGEIMPLISWATENRTGEKEEETVAERFDFAAFKTYLSAFDNTFVGECAEEIDLVRRALLTMGLHRYPRIFRGNLVYTFGWDWSDWKTLINDNLEQFKHFFDELIDGKTCEDLIASYPACNDWAEFVHEAPLMAYCEQKKLQYYHHAWYLMKKERWHGEHANVGAYKFYLYLHTQPNPTNWSLNFYPYYDTCVYYDREHAQTSYIAIDIIWNEGAAHDQIAFNLFMKPTDQPAVTVEAQRKLKPVADALGYEWEEGRYRKYLPISTADYQMIEAERESIFQKIEELHL